MSELGEIHEKINGVALDVRGISDILKVTLPKLTNKDEVDRKLAECSLEHSRTKRTALESVKNPYTISTALAAIATGIWALVQAIQ